MTAPTLRTARFGHTRTLLRRAWSASALALCALALWTQAGCGDDGGSGGSDTAPADTAGDAVAAGSIAGTVTLEGGADPAGARITVAGQTQDAAADGTWRFDSVAAGEHVVRASLDGYVAQEKPATVVADAVTTVDFTLVAAGPDNRAPVIESLEVLPTASLVPLGTAEAVVVATDADGDALTYQWTATGGFTVEATGPGHAALTAPAGLNVLGTVEVLVEDGQGASATQQVSVATADAVATVTVTLEADREQVEPGGTLNLTAQATASTGGTLSFQWEVSSPTWTLTPSGPTAVLQAPDQSGASATVTVTAQADGGEAVDTLAVSTSDCASGMIECDGDVSNGCEALDSGLGSSCPARSCLAIQTSGTVQPDGTYWIDPEGGSTEDAFQVYCDLTTDGGGWTLLGTISGGDADAWATQFGAWSDTSTLGSAAAPWADYKSPAWSRLGLSSAQLLYQRRYNGAVEALAVLEHGCIGNADNLGRLFAVWDTSRACGPRRVRVLQHSANGLASAQYEEGVGALGLGGAGTNGLCWNGEGTGVINFKGHFVWNGVPGAGCSQPTHAGAIGIFESSFAQLEVGDLGATNWLVGTELTATDISFFARDGVLVQGALTAADPGRWGDGTVASSCAAYRSPELPYVYDGAVGDGVYRIDADGAGVVAPFPVWCDMTTDGGGWIGLRLDQADNLVVAEAAATNPWHKCADDSAKHFDWITEGQVTADYSAGSATHEASLAYLNEADGLPLTVEQLAALRASITELAPSTRMVAVESDNDYGTYQDGGAFGHELSIMGTSGTWLLLTPGANGECGGGVGTYPAPGSRSGYYLWHNSVSELAVDGDVGAFTAAELTPLAVGDLLPERVRLDIYTGGGLAFGYERQVILVK